MTLPGRQDITAGLLVFLIALPLCLGIALASGFPAVAGILTAIVGGTLVSALGGAELTIKGPAAGLIVIVFGAVTELGGGDLAVGYRRTLAVCAVAALLQIGFALLRSGRLASAMPPAVVRGMLAAIGVIIVTKQLPVMLGRGVPSGEVVHVWAELPHLLATANPVIAMLGGASLLTLIAWPWLRRLKAVPGPVVVLAACIPLSLMLGMSSGNSVSVAGATAAVGPQHLVQLPGSLLDAIAFPDVSQLLTWTSFKYIWMLALVGSLESLLSVVAVDSMDPEPRSSNLDRDLLATGIGNLVCALIGGLPMISEIVRSKANVDAGATGRWANAVHGLALLLFVALVPGVLSLIPMAALAAMLVLTGARLASPKTFRHAWQVGPDQVLVTTVTFVTTLLTDLLVGVAAGVVAELLLHVWRGVRLRELFRRPAVAHRDGDRLVVRVHGPAVFTNLVRLELDVAPDVREVVVDVTEAPLVDHTVIARISAWASEWPAATLRWQGLETLRPASTHPLASRAR